MSTRRLGSTQQYSDGWDRAFGKGAKSAKGTKTAKKKSSTATGRVARSAKSSANKKKTTRAKK